MISGTYLHSTLKFGKPTTKVLKYYYNRHKSIEFWVYSIKRLLKIRHWWLKNKERKVDFRFIERKFLAAIILTGSAEGALVPVLLRITHETKGGLPVSTPCWQAST